LARGGERGEPAGIAAPHDARGSVVRCAICAQILAPAHDAAGVLGQVLAPGAIAAAAPVWGLPGP